MAGVAAKLDLTGWDGVLEYTAGMAPAKRKRLWQGALIAAGLAVVRRAQEGEILRGGGKGPAHPTKLTSRTGTLRRSLKLDRGGLNSLFVDAGTDLVYGPPHEFGSPRQGLPARPFMRPALDWVMERELDGIVDRALRQVVA